VMGTNDEVYVLDELLFSTVDSSIILSLSVIFMKKSLFMYGNFPIVKNC
jgi:hypothetical protein